MAGGRYGFQSVGVGDSHCQPGPGNKTMQLKMTVGKCVGLGFGAVLVLGEETAAFGKSSVVGDGAAGMVPVRSFSN